MTRGPTLIDLIVRDPRMAVAVVAMFIGGMISGRPEVAVLFGMIAFVGIKKGMFDWLRSDQSGYLDREAQRPDWLTGGQPDEERIERMPRYSDFVLTEPEDEEEAQDAWTLPPEVQTDAVVDVTQSTARPASEARFGIAVPPRKQVDVPRR